MHHISSSVRNSVLAAAVCFAAASAIAQTTGKLTDLQIADVAYTAGQADIGTAILAAHVQETPDAMVSIRRSAHNFLREFGLFVTDWNEIVLSVLAVSRA